MYLSETGCRQAHSESNPIRWQNFSDGWSLYFPFTLFLRNSTIITAHNVIANLASCTLVAYGFARLRTRESDVLFALVLATMMVPEQVTMIPVYYLFTRLDWVNTFLPLTVPAWFGYPFFIFLLRQFFLTLPRELDDAARIDGCSTWGILYRILLPLSAPGLVASGIFSFTLAWNEFLLALVITMGQNTMTVPIKLSMMVVGDQYIWGQLMAGAVLGSVPIVILYVFFLDYYVSGLTAGAVK